MQISWTESQCDPIFNMSVRPKWWTVTHSSMAEALGGGAAHTRTHKNMHIVFLFLFSLNDTSQGHMFRAAFGIPGEARLPHQAEQVRRKVGTHGRSVSLWMPNVNAHPNPERWDRTLKLQSLEEGGGWGRRGGKSTGGRKTGGSTSKQESFMNYERYCDCWLLHRVPLVLGIILYGQYNALFFLLFFLHSNK